MVCECGGAIHCRGMCQRCYLRQYKAANRERIRELNRRWEAENRDKIAERRREIYQTDPDRRAKRLEVNRRSAQRADPEIAIRQRRRYYADNKEVIAAKAQEKWIEKTYGIPPGGYDVLLAAQNGRCGICNTAKPKGGRFVVDHCHDTGKVRGLLCRKCNTGIGQLCDDPEKVRAALRWLEHREDAR